MKLPLSLRENGDANSYAILDGDGKWLLSLLHNGEMLVAEQRENLRHLIACANACHGLKAGWLEQAAPEPDTVAVDATPFAWAMFDGEGGHILMLYEGNETLQDDWNAAHPNGYPNWITPLYEAPPVTPNSSIVAVDAGRGPYGGRLTGDSVAQDPSTAPETPATVAVDAGALEALRSAMSKLRAPMSRTEYGAARACIIEAANRLLAVGE